MILLVPFSSAKTVRQGLSLVLSGALFLTQVAGPAGNAWASQPARAAAQSGQLPANAMAFLASKGPACGLFLQGTDILWTGPGTGAAAQAGPNSTAGQAGDATRARPEVLRGQGRERLVSLLSSGSPERAEALLAALLGTTELAPAACPAAIAMVLAGPRPPPFEISGPGGAGARRGAAAGPVAGASGLVADLRGVEITGRTFDGGGSLAGAEPVAGFGSGFGAAGRGRHAAGEALGTGLAAQGRQGAGNGTFAPVPFPGMPGAGNPRGQPPDNAKGRWARILGALGAGAGVGAASFFLWGPAAAAYFVAGSAIKSLKYNSEHMGPLSGKIWGGLDRYSQHLRMLAGTGLVFLGLFTGNPVAAYFGLTFAILGTGELVSKGVFDWARKLMDKPAAARLGARLDGALHRAAATARNAAASVRDRVDAARRWLGLKDSPKPAPEPGRKPSLLRRAADFVYRNRGELAKTAAASLVTMGMVGGVSLAVHATLANAVGTMAPATNNLTLQDKARNTLIGAYRLYNMPGTVFKNGPNTRRFYDEMRVKYNPKTPEDWAEVIENEITWVAHNDLYGTNAYYITSEEAALVRAFNGVAGRYSDCTGKAALLQNLLKLDGYGPSHLVVGVPRLGNGNEGHAWIINPNASGPKNELFHYENTMDLLEYQHVTAAQGIRGDQLAAFAGGGAGGLLTNLVYTGLDALDAKAAGLRARVLDWRKRLQERAR